MPDTQQRVRPARAPLFALFSANAISMVGNVLSSIAIPWFVLQTTGSAAKIGLTEFCIILPIVLAAFFGGSIVDRLGYKRVSIIADCASTLTTALIPLLYDTIGLEFWQLLALVFLGNLLNTPGTTARDAFVPDLAATAMMSLERAGSATQVIERSSRLIGAPLAGVLVAIMGASQVLWIDAATFAASAAIIALAVPRQPRPNRADVAEPYLTELAAGFTFLWQDRLLRAVIVVVMVTNLLDAALSGVVRPVYIKQFYGSALDLGLIAAASGGGAVIGALLFGAFSPRLPRRAIFIGGFLLIGIGYLATALVPPFWALILLFLGVGLAAGPLNPIISTIEYSRIAAPMRGRVFGTITAGANIGTPLGVLGAGFVLEYLDVRLTIGLLSFAYIATTASLLFIPATRAIAAPPAQD